MEIALIADDTKKELMTQFCIAYCGILSKHNLCATGTTGKYIEEATGLRVEKLLSGEHGGEQQITSRVAYNEIDVLALRGNILTFVSCKGGNMEGKASLDPMYQLDAIASRFGGKYARKILATRCKIDGVYAERAAAMKIKLEKY